MYTRKTLRKQFVLAVAVVMILQGCGEGRSAWQWRNPFKPAGHEWTILCIELDSSRRRTDAEKIAETLRRTPGVDSRLVGVAHGRRFSRVYYGSYRRFPDEKTGRLNVPQKMRDDITLIKDLAGPQGGLFFLDARIVPAPTPDVGNPAWALDNNPGIYTLRIAIFYNEGKMTDRKRYAAEYCTELRNKGYAAYYRHGEITSEVYVGSFGEDAVQPVRRQGIVAYVPAGRVRALQQKENFKYELWNMKVFAARGGDQSVRRGSRVIRVEQALRRYADQFTEHETPL